MIKVNAIVKMASKIAPAYLILKVFVFFLKRLKKTYANKAGAINLKDDLYEHASGKRGIRNRKFLSL